MKNLIRRYGKFTVVGAMGLALQLYSLAVLHRIMPAHYLWATAIALEITLLHNFVWHIHFTWQDRNRRASWLGPFVRFHLSNGLISMAGNLGGTALLVRHTHLPLILSNLIAILCISAVTFCLGNLWAFKAPRPDLIPEFELPG